MSSGEPGRPIVVHHPAMFGYLMRIAPAVLRSRLNVDGSLVSRVDRRVRFAELDINRHMNQAVYAQVMEIGRTDWVLRSRGWDRWRAQGIHPVVANQHIVYRRELSLGTRYTIDSRAIGMNGRLLVMRSLILVGDQVHASNDVEMIFIGPKGVLSERETLAVCDGLFTTPLPVDDWRVQSE